jgi:DNA-binding GntR family transcriptional regulator
VLAVYVVRESLEGLAARLAALRSSPRVAATLSALIERMQDPQVANDLPQLVELNLDLHRAIRDATGNSYLERFLTQVEHAVRRLDRTTYELPGRIEESLAEHRGIVDAIIAADPQLAERLAVQHMRRAREIRTQMLLGG